MPRASSRSSSVAPASSAIASSAIVAAASRSSGSCALAARSVGDVEDHAVEARGAVGADDLLPALEHPRRRPVRPHDAVFEPVGTIGGRRSPHPAVHVLAIVRVDDAPERAARALDEVRRRIAGDPLDLVADHRHRPVGVERAAIDGAGNVRDDGGQLPVALVRLHAPRPTESPNRRILHRLVIAHASGPDAARRQGYG